MWKRRTEVFRAFRSGCKNLSCSFSFFKNTGQQESCWKSKPVQRLWIQAWPESMHPVIALKMSSSYLKTLIGAWKYLYILCPWVTEIRIFISGTQKKASAKPNITCWVKKTVKVTEPYLQLCKNKDWPNPRLLVQRESTMPWCCSQQPPVRRRCMQHVAHPRGEHRQEQLTIHYAQVAVLNYEYRKLNFSKIENDK